MPSLHDTQALFWEAIRWPTGVADFLAQCDPATAEAFAETFAGSPELDAVERLEVYANAYYWRLFGVLETHFATVSWRLGYEHFNNLVTDFVLDMPSRDPDLSRLGVAFPEFVAHHSVSKAHPELADIARVERARVAVLDAADHEVAAAADLGRIPAGEWPSLRFALSPAMTVVETGFDVTALWQARVDGERSAEVRAPTTPPGVHTLVWRRGHTVIHRPLPAAESRALACAARGGNFVDMCAAAAGPGGDEVEPARVVAFLHNWLGGHLVAALRATNSA